MVSDKLMLTRLQKEYPEMKWTREGNKFRGEQGSKYLAFIRDGRPETMTWMNIDSAIEKFKDETK